MLIGRPVIWGLATGGATGAQAVWTAFTTMIRAMALCGARTVEELTSDLVAG
ncbi:MAG TPA: alpha-hydroxy-acid oxidizing protein [Sporichthyaceae bacterium]